MHSATRSTRSSSAAPPYLWAGIGAAIAAAVGIGVGLGLRKRGGSGATAALSSELSPLDRDIISIIEQNGGSILQSELQKRLGVPKTTLWRHIRKLEKLGIVKVLKEGGYNKIVLERKL
ncbi:MAG: winged helix-turn-helix transcriptional regulator [Crenarchaeota archaeon]|nr:winged helix-turn-helix transcriptional regulator [Thermoproteota archaeon]